MIAPPNKSAMRCATIAVLIVLYCLMGTKTSGLGIDRMPGAGLAPYMSLSDAKKYLASDNEELKSVLLTIQWKDIERVEGTYRLDKLLSPLIALARTKNRYLAILFCVGDNCPPWLYDEGVL